MSKLSLQAVLEVLDKASKPLKDIQDKAKRLTASFEAQQATLKKLNRTQADITSFKRLSSELDKTRGEMKDAQIRAQQLAQAHAAITNPTKAMTKELDRARLAVKQLKLAEQDQIQHLQRLRQSLTQAGVSTRTLGDDEKRLRSQIKDVTDALRKKKTALDQVSNIQKQYAADQARISKLGGMGMNAGIQAAAGTAAISVPIKAYAESESAATDLRVSMMQANGQVAKQFGSINALADKLGTQLPGTTADFKQMMNVLVKEGISADKILDGIGESAAYVGLVMKMDYPASAKFVAQLSDATKTASGDMLQFMDQIQRMHHTGLDPDWMLQGFVGMAAGMKVVRLECLKGTKAMGPLLTMLGNAGMTEGGSAGNAISKVLSSSLDLDMKTKLSKLNKDYDISLNLDFTNGKGEFAGIEKMYKELDKLKKFSSSERGKILEKIWGNDKETIFALNTIIDNGQAGYDSMVKKMADQANLQQRVNAQLGTLTNLWDAASGTFTNAMVNFGESIAPELKTTVTWLTNITEKVGAWSKANPQLSNTIMKTIAFVVLLLAAFSALSLGLVALLGPMALLRLTFGVLGAKGFGFISIIKMIGSAAMWLGRMIFTVGRLMLTNPLILAITLLAVAAYMIYRNWEPIKQFFIGIWNSITAGASQVWQQIQGFFNSGIANISATIINWSPIGLFYQAFAAVMNYFGIQLPSTFTGFGQMLMQGLGNGIISAVGAVVEKAKAAAAQVTSSVKSTFGIHSPSRVFAQLGAYNMQGLALGIDQNSNLPNKAMLTASQGLLGVFDTAQPMVNQPFSFDRRKPLTASVPGATATPISFQQVFNIYPSAGMDEQALAQLVAQEVAKAQRMAEASQRRSFSDL
ncbi:phage tail tape measure protein [Acinetobacter dispersus]|uniref:phage tail tape measure protein n=1 Tax=Acinetobacter dispersus TaxID=70348 RepID=UPI00132F2A0B|nr:phage tail tape measure protein [Acinetobacter dispersus]QHH99228.1 phage tail tape measure protein [Acinetobacter dispersus]